MSVYIYERERERKREIKRERERESEKKKLPFNINYIERNNKFTTTGITSDLIISSIYVRINVKITTYKTHYLKWHSVTYLFIFNGVLPRIPQKKYPVFKKSLYNS